MASHAGDNTLDENSFGSTGGIEKVFTSIIRAERDSVGVGWLRIALPRPQVMGGWLDG